MQLNPIKKLRIERCLKQAELEKLTGISQQRISLLERYVQKPTADEIKRLSDAFGLAEED